jgi:hypothetical protein
MRMGNRDPLPRMGRQRFIGLALDQSARDKRGGKRRAQGRCLLLTTAALLAEKHDTSVL